MICTECQVYFQKTPRHSIVGCGSESKSLAAESESLLYLHGISESLECENCIIVQ